MTRTDRGGRALASKVLALALLSAPATGDNPSHRPAASESPWGEIRRILDDPEVAAHISSWGLSVADVQHDVDVMTPTERARLAAALTRSWPTDTGYTQARYRAQYLVTVSLLRESTLFANVLSSRIRHAD